MHRGSFLFPDRERACPHGSEPACFLQCYRLQKSAGKALKSKAIAANKIICLVWDFALGIGCEYTTKPAKCLRSLRGARVRATAEYRRKPALSSAVHTRLSKTQASHRNAYL